MSSDISNYLRRGFNNNAIINKILQELQKVQPEITGDAKQERIEKISEVYQITDTVTATRWQDALLLEDGTSYLLTETDKKIYLEVGNT